MPAVMVETSRSPSGLLPPLDFRRVWSSEAFGEEKWGHVRRETGKE